MTHSSNGSRTDRRSFLKIAGLGAVGAAATAASTVAVTAEAAPPSDKKGGYRETEHVKRVYELARF
ncbi:MAG: formate dehydrogenase [Alphaproteobacteria bacterium]|nr:formate dehydrogenase [Alphaproteobacteria bacterium]